MNKPAFFQLDQIEWIDEHKEVHRASDEMIEEAKKVGARRKRLADGECGYYSQYTTMPAGYEVPPHSHNHDELFVVLSGGCQLVAEGGETVTLAARDSAALAAGREYGFTVGDQGIEFMVIRPGQASADFG